MFVADFIGSPPMNFLAFEGALAPGDRSVTVQGAPVAVPELREGGKGGHVLGARPEHVRFDDASRLRGSVYGTEYLGTQQIVTVETAGGMVKARIPADVRISTGETVGLAFDAARLSLFEAAGGRALATAAREIAAREAGHG